MSHKQGAITPLPAASSAIAIKADAVPVDEDQLSHLKVKKWLIENALDSKSGQKQQEHRHNTVCSQTGLDVSHVKLERRAKQNTISPEMSHEGMLSTGLDIPVSDEEALDDQLDEDLDSKWILNLSMRLRDKSDREKFFVTYAEQPNKRRRLTISIDYNHSQLGTLEGDLKDMYYQRDKSFRIYESMRETLLQIRFFETVTNLKLRTIEGQLHVHCSEDKNEVIRYPRALQLSYLPFPIYREYEVVLESHISGFVYKVTVDDQIFIKKEIAGPGSVDEFMYELTALSTLYEASNVVTLRGLVADNSGAYVKGLLLEYASEGALMDIIYDCKHEIALPWARREKWARQIVNGLSEVHEAGFVQGDLTLSNIVIDSEDNARLIDINRRGCPIGWEPPELEILLRAGQNISMFIGVKTDLYQLGMALWGLAMCNDEPQIQSRPLPAITGVNAPAYLKHVIQACLQTDPSNRLSAKELLALFPPTTQIDHDDVDFHLDEIDHERSAGRSDSYNQRLILPSRGKDDADAPSHVSGASSIRTRGVDTVGSSDCMSDGPGRSALRCHSTRDCSPATQPEKIA